MVEPKSDKKPASDKDPKREKPKAIEILKVWRTKKRIVIRYRKGDDEITEKSRDNPRKAFDDCLDALVPVVLSILHLPKDYDEGMRIMGFAMSEKKGAQGVSVFARKDLSDAAKEFPIETPVRLLEHPTDPGSYTPAIPKDQVDLVREAISAAKEYVRGERAQGQLSLEDEEDEDGDGPEDDPTAPLDFEAEAKAAK